jgi:MFS superfamily sulfate permease-like transporter
MAAHRPLSSPSSRRCLLWASAALLAAVRLGNKGKPVAMKATGSFSSLIFPNSFSANNARQDLRTLTPERVVRDRVLADSPCSRLLLFNLEGELFFGSAPVLEEHLNTIERRSCDGIRVIVLRMKRVRSPDAACLELGPKQLFHEMPSVWSSTLDAIQHAYDLLGNDFCVTCPRRNEMANSKEAWYCMI